MNNLGDNAEWVYLAGAFVGIVFVVLLIHFMFLPLEARLIVLCMLFYMGAAHGIELIMEHTGQGIGKIEVKNVGGHWADAYVCTAAFWAILRSRSDRRQPPPVWSESLKRWGISLFQMAAKRFSSKRKTRDDETDDHRDCDLQD